MVSILLIIMKLKYTRENDGYQIHIIKFVLKESNE